MSRAKNPHRVYDDPGYPPCRALGMPLYLWSKDQKPGDVTGDGVNKVWHAVKPPPRPIDAGNMNGP